MADFPVGRIDVREASVNYGPFAFDFTNALPTGTTISSATVKTYLGRVTQDDALASETDTSSEVVDAGLTAVSGNYGVNVYFNYPTTAAYKDEKHTIVFTLTLNNTAVHSYFFHYVYVA